MARLPVQRPRARGKKQEHLFIHVDREAYVSCDSWLATGWALWQNVSPDRDYFLTLPNHDLTDALLLEAQYADCAAMSRALLERLRTASGDPLLFIASASAFWTEHADRATVPSLAACIVNTDDATIRLLCRRPVSQAGLATLGLDQNAAVKSTASCHK